MRQIIRVKRHWFAFLLGIVIFLTGNLGLSFGKINSGLLPATAQELRPDQASVQELRPDQASVEVYKLFTDLPLENQYLSQETGETATENTLVSRLIRYHQYVKSRPLQYRLDWKLTIADYFGINETIQARRYPGSITLRSNPLEGDRAIIKNLTRAQRNKLVDTLVSIYNPQVESTSPTVEQSPVTPSPSPTENSNTKPKLPQPGDAELLLP